MATPILQVITQYCDKFVDDIRIRNLNKEGSPQYNPPLYAREMWGYLLPAIPLFSLPSNMVEYLLGTEEKPNIVYPRFDSAQRTLEEDKDSNFVIPLGDDFAGFEVVSCRLKETDAAGYTYFTPLNFEYNAETGAITVILAEGETLLKDSVLDIDLYKDGQFLNTLTPRIMLILGLCFRCMWRNRFNEDWLSLVPKVDDKSFTEQNRASKENADTDRKAQVDMELADELRKYEQDIYYRKHSQPLPLL